MARVFQLGGSPLTPRIAVWRRDPGFALGVFFCPPCRSDEPWLLPAYRDAAAHPYPVAVGRYGLS
jgi:hypothetical protein